MSKSRIILLISLLLILFPFVNYYIITWISRPFIFNTFGDLPESENILVFGAGRNYPSDHPNYAFNSRIAAAERIVTVKEIRNIIISGRNEPPHYDELTAISEALEKRIDSLPLIADTASNTLESIRNYKNSFRDQNVILISNKTHLERAVFYCRMKNINAAGYAVTDNQSGFTWRELGARIKTSFYLLFR